MIKDTNGLTQTFGQPSAPIPANLALNPRRAQQLVAPRAAEDGPASVAVVVLLQLQMGLLQPSRGVQGRALHWLALWDVRRPFSCEKLTV